MCAFDACKPFDYASIVGSDGQTFATLGTVACYGAFAVGALALITAYACWQKTIVAVSAARLTGIAALALIAVAIAFVLEQPGDLRCEHEPVRTSELHRAFGVDRMVGRRVSRRCGSRRHRERVAVVPLRGLDQQAGRRELRAQLADLAGDPSRARDASAGAADDLRHPRRDLLHLRLLMPRLVTPRADPDPRRIERLARIERDRVVVELDAGDVERLRGDLAGDVLRREVGEDQVVVGATGDQREALLDHRRGERLRVRDDLRARTS